MRMSSAEPMPVRTRTNWAAPTLVAD
jgi:hypothetical protein